MDGKMTASVFQTVTEMRASNVEKAGQFLDYALARRTPLAQVKYIIIITGSNHYGYDRDLTNDHEKVRRTRR